MNIVIWLCAGALLSGPNEDAAAASRGSKVPVQAAVVMAKYDLAIPGQEAGVLMALETDDGTEVTEGIQIEKGGLLARIDDSKSQLQKVAAQREFESAELQANNDAPVKAARATTQVAEAEYLKSLEINKRSKNAVSEFELRRLMLTWIRSQKQEEVAQLEQDVARSTMEIKRAQIDAAELDIVRRQVHSPIEGEVVEVLKKAGEWVTPGDSVLRVVDMKRLRVQGLLDSRTFSPELVHRKKVQVTVLLPDREETFSGRIDYVSQIVNPTTGDFFVRAEIENRKSNGFWVMRPGMTVEMVIDLAPAAEK